MNIKKMCKLLLVSLCLILFSTLSSAVTIKGLGSTFELNKGIGFDGVDGEDREAAFVAATQFWADIIVSPVTIEIDAEFSDLSCSTNSAVLGSAGPFSAFLTDAESIGLKDNVLYSTALINAYKGSDLFGGGDIDASFNTNLGNADCLSSSGWYYGLDGNTPRGKINFYEVVQHELGHSLGFLSLVNDDGTDNGQVDIFTTFLHDQSTGKDWTAMSSSERNISVNNTGNVVWSGANVTNLVSKLTAGVNSGKVQLFAPDVYQAGSSISHFDSALTPNELMEPTYTGNSTFEHTIALLKDIGWPTIAQDTTPTPPINVAPVIVGQNSLLINEDTSLTISLNNLSVTDSDSNYPANFSLTVNEGVNYTLSGFTITPSHNFYGLLTVPVTVNDGIDNSTSYNLNVVVTPINDAPVITGSPLTTATENTPYSFSPMASDVDSSDNLRFTIINKPIWATFNTSTGVLIGTPSKSDVGVISNIIITTMDNNGLSVSLPAFSITVTAKTNSRPKIINQSFLSTDEDTRLTLQLNNLLVMDNDNNYPADFSLTVSRGSNYSVSELTITPDNNFFGTLVVPVKVNDGIDNSTPYNLNVTVNEVNDAPNAQDDNILLAYNKNGLYIIDVLNNDTDVEGDSLAIISARSSIGTVSIESGKLVYKVQGVIGRSIEILYSINDGNTVNGNSEAKVTINFDSNIGESLPIITLPANIEVNATALFTKVNLGTATAIDSKNQEIPASIIDDITHFLPGNNLVHWQAQDSEGLKKTSTQQVTVHPLINMPKEITGTEGEHYKVAVYLNGESPHYPLIINYDVSGDADSTDHDLVSGELIIESGLVGYIEFNTFNDGITEENESIIITLENTLNLGVKSTFILTLTEDNIAPQVTALTSQNNEQRTLIGKELGNVVINSKVFDVNSHNNHRYFWSSNNNTLIDIDADATSFTFDPAIAEVGQKILTLTVTDDGDIPLSNTILIYLDIVESLTALTDRDSDKDLIPDNIEGYADTDGDGIANYLDSNNSRCNIQPQEAAESSLYFIETEPGICLYRGINTVQNASGSLLLNTNEVVNDTATKNIGGLFDFRLGGLPIAGENISVVLPQRLPVPENGTYRKLSTDKVWGEFIENNKNYYSSSAGEKGYCPVPNADNWTLGLTEGHWCVQLTIEDGGENDNDGLVNNNIVNIGGVSIWINANTLPKVNDDQVDTPKNTSITINVLTNDIDGNNLIISSAKADIGLVTIIQQQLFYQPETNFVGQAIITYEVTDNNNSTASGHVFINVIETAPPNIIDSNESENNNEPENSNGSEGSSGDSGGNLSIFSLITVCIILFCRRKKRYQ